MPMLYLQDEEKATRKALAERAGLRQRDFAAQLIAAVSPSSAVYKLAEQTGETVFEVVETIVSTFGAEYRKRVDAARSVLAGKPAKKAPVKKAA